MTTLIMSERTPIREQIRTGLAVLRLSANWLGPQIGERPETVRRWLRGDTTMTTDQFEKIRDALYAEAQRQSIEFRFNVTA